MYSEFYVKNLNGVVQVLCFPTCKEIIRKLTNKFISRMKISENYVIKSIVRNYVYHISSIGKHWRNMLFTEL